MLFTKNSVQKSCRLQEQDHHDHRHNKFDHHNIKLLSGEFTIGMLHLLNNPLWLHKPSNQDRREDRNERHQEAVTDIIHDI